MVPLFSKFPWIPLKDEDYAWYDVDAKNETQASALVDCKVEMTRRMLHKNYAKVKITGVWQIA